MHPGRPLPELARELQRQAGAKRDFVAPARELKIQTNGHSQLIVNEPLQLNTVAHSQRAAYLDIPKAFYDRLLNASENLRLPVQATPDALTDSLDRPLFDVLVNRLLRSK